MAAQIYRLYPYGTDQPLVIVLSGDKEIHMVSAFGIDRLNRWFERWEHSIKLNITLNKMRTHHESYRTI